MADQWKNKAITRISFNIESDSYEKIKSQFYHGQFTQFVRQMIDSLEILIESNKVKEILYYLNDEADLVLPVKKRMKNDLSWFYNPFYSSFI